MSIFDRFIRKGQRVTLVVDSSLDVNQPKYEWDWNCNDEKYAELLTLRLNKQLREYKREIARKAVYYLSCEEVSALKRELTRWNGKKHCWKR